MAHRTRILDALLRGSRDGEIQAFLDFDHSLAQLMDRIDEGKGCEWIGFFLVVRRLPVGPEASSDHPKKSPVL
ncbi:hypothetical protein GCM10009016_08210 [Halomonas beimenensis]